MNQLASCILLLGPSGIGKTTVIKHLQKKLKSVQAISLDNIAHRHAKTLGVISATDNLNALIDALEQDRERLFTFGIEALEAYCNQMDDQPVLVDVGTGFLDAPSSLAWVHQHQSISLITDQACAYERFRKQRKLDITYEQYIATQYRPSRISIYNKAAVVIRSDSIDEKATTQRVAFALFGLCPEPVGRQLADEWFTAMKTVQTTTA